MEGLSEKELQQWHREESFLGGKVKKRMRKDLSVGEMDAIVAAAHKPYRL